MCSQDRHARLYQPNMQVMNFLYSIDLHSNTTFRQWPALMCDCWKRSATKEFDEQSKDKDHQQVEITC